MRLRHAACAARTGSGHAPKAPWLRNTTSGSRPHCARKSVGFVMGANLSARGATNPRSDDSEPSGGDDLDGSFSSSWRE